MNLKQLQFQCLPLFADTINDIMIVAAMHRILTSMISVLITHRHELNGTRLLEPNSRQCFGD